MLSGSTTIYAILGDPVEHSLSPVIHNAAFEAAGIDAAMVGLRVRPEMLPEAVQVARALGLGGLAVTMPHKKAIIPLLDEVEPAAALIEAVNVVERRQDKFVGLNTDGKGFCDGLLEKQADPAGKRVFIFGAGGAARSVTAELAARKVSSLTICNIDPEETGRLLRILSNWSVKSAGCPFDKKGASFALKQADIIINATSMGMAGKPAGYLDFLDWNAISPDAVFADAVYKPLLTPLLAEAQRRGHKTVTGDRMLLFQGVLAYKCWTGTAPPVEIMDSALRRCLMRVE